MTKIYKVSLYLEDHPGGGDILLEVAGTDATKAFEETGHSESAREVMTQFCVGDLDIQVGIRHWKTSAKTDISLKEHKEITPAYRTDFKQVSMSPTMTKQQAPFLRRLLRRTTIAVGSLTAVSLMFLKRHRLFSSAAQWMQGVTQGSLTTSWRSVAAASTGQLVLTLSILTWAWSKLNARESHGLFPAYRTSSNDRTILPFTAPRASLSLLDARKYRKFPLSSRIQTSPNTHRFVFDLPKSSDTLMLPPGQHIVLQGTVDGETISRSYTPVSEEFTRGHFELLVKVYETGHFTKRYLAEMKLGDAVEVRGPVGMMKYKNGFAKTLIMIAGGTGITPMYQIVRKVCADSLDKTMIRLLYAINDEEDILLRQALEHYVTTEPSKFTLQHVLLRPPHGWSGETGFITQHTIESLGVSASDDAKVLVCGPPAMVEAQKKNLRNLGFRLPGVLPKPTDQVYIF